MPGNTLDLKDRRILSKLDENARISCAQLGRAVGVSQEVAYQRIARLRQRGIITRFQTVVAVRALGYLVPKIYLQLQNLRKDESAQLLQYLSENDAVFWIGICQGRWDIIIGCWTQTISEFGQILDNLLSTFSEQIREREITIGRSTVQYNRRWLLPSSAEPLETRFEIDKDQVPTDDKDISLLRHLANNARMSATDLAQNIGVAASVVRYRIKELERKKVIQGYKIAIDTQKLGYETCKALIRLKRVSEERKRALLEFCKLQENVINVVLCVGPWDMEVEFEVRSFDHFYDIMEEIRSHFSDIISGYESVVFKEEPKQSFMPGSLPQAP